VGGLKRLSGDDVIRILLLAGFVVHSQKGSHVKLRRVLGDETQTLTIPRHRELDTGTLRAIVRQAGRFLSDAWLKEHFFDA
jgi:predicted RNA binding protein YcfA (HicA-like mRNA interferase family)